jgi:hypothetical protein
MFRQWFPVRFVVAVVAIIVLAATFCAGRTGHSLQSALGSNRKERVFEIRTYTCEHGKLPALLARFRDHTTRLFEKHGMTNIGYWVPIDGERSRNTLIYILAHDSRAAADKSWQAFRTDPVWLQARDASEAAGKIVSKVESVFLAPTNFSKIR